MRGTWYLVCCAMSLVGLGLNVAAANVVTVNLTGHVVNVSDSSLGITVGQAVTGTYSYDSSTLLGGDGAYHPTSPPASISVSVGGQTYQSQSNWAYQIILNPDPAIHGIDFEYVAEATAPANPLSPPLPPNIGLHFDGQWPISTAALPTSAPPFGLMESLISVELANSSGFVAQVDSATLVPTTLTISPASNIFAAQQNFDAALLLSSQTTVTSMQATVGGTPIALSYPGTCQLVPVISAGTVLVCPNASAVLATLGSGPVTINWQVVLGDGSTLQQSVTWTLFR